MLSNYNTRHKQMLDAAKRLVKKDDYTEVKASAVAKAVGVSGPLVFAHFGDRDTLRAETREYILHGTIKSKPARAAKPKAAKAIKSKSKPARAAKPKAPKVAKPKAPKVAKPKASKFAPPSAPANVE